MQYLLAIHTFLCGNVKEVVIEELIDKKLKTLNYQLNQVALKTNLVGKEALSIARDDIFSLYPFEFKNRIWTKVKALAIKLLKTC